MQQNNLKYGLTPTYCKSLKIPKLLSQSIGHYLTIKQIKDEKNNFSIIEKINQLSNLVKCMKKKIRIICMVENERKHEKISKAISNVPYLNKDLSANKLCNIILKKLDLKNSKYEVIN